MRQFTLFLAAAFLVGAAVALQEIRVGGGSRYMINRVAR
jgi:hypothetical protein